MKFAPSPAVRAALFRSFCCFSQLMQRRGKSVKPAAMLAAPQKDVAGRCEVGAGKDGTCRLAPEL